MDIVSIIASLPISGNLILGSPMKVEWQINTNTKIEIINENEKNIQIQHNENSIKNESDTTPVHNNQVLEKSEEEIKREKILARWEGKQLHLKKDLPKEKFIGNFSAYTAAADECGKSDGITASGVKVKINRTLACPPQYPFGTKIKVSGMGTYVCEDRGGAIKGNKFDIYMETKKEAFAFGRRHLEVEVIN